MGKKFKNGPLKKKADASWTVNASPTARNLSKNQLGAVIFGCLPAAHYSYVKNISPGLPLFLFNYSDRKLHGIFQAVSCGQLNMDQYAWTTSEGSEFTPYGAQVRMDFQTKCQPLSEDEYKPIIEKNYYSERLFWFELDKAQTHRLIQLFLSSPLQGKIPRPPKEPKQVNNMFDVLCSSDVRVAAHKEFENLDPHSNPGLAELKSKESGNSYASILVTTHASEPTGKWTDLFGASSSPNNGTMSKPPPYSWADAAEVESETKEVNCWEKQALVDHHEPKKEMYENPEPYLQCHELDSERLDEWGVPSSVNCWEEPKKEMYENPEPYLQCHELDSERLDQWGVPSSVVNCWEEHALVNHYDPQETYENAEPHSRCHELESERVDHCGLTSSDKVLLSDREGSELETSDSQIQSDLADRAVQENCNALFGEGVLTVTDTQSFDSESVISKMMQEIEGFKFSQLKQRLKMDSLEQELVHSKIEIDQLKKRCLKLESMRSFASDQCNVEDCVTSEEYVLIVGGSDGNSYLSDLIMYSPLQDNVVSLCPVTFPRSGASVAKLNGELYIFGGTYDGVWYDTVESYNPIINQWIQRPSLSKKKGSMAGASLYETIFAMGGGNGVECFSEVELLDLNIGSWMSTQSMLEKRMGAAAAYMNGALYVAGGFDGKEYLRSVERFDPRQHAWSRVASMNSKRGNHSLVALKKELYALGGYDGKNVVSTVEVFDPRIGSWMMEEPMSIPRINFGSFFFGGKIYAIGGMNDDDVVDVIECYESGSSWQLKGRSKLGRRSFLSALVI
ncbi:hypothetical protein OROHE_009777 [Orobanche hederae]